MYNRAAGVYFFSKCAPVNIFGTMYTKILKENKGKCQLYPQNFCVHIVQNVVALNFFILNYT